MDNCRVGFQNLGRRFQSDFYQIAAQLSEVTAKARQNKAGVSLFDRLAAPDMTFNDEERKWYALVRLSTDCPA